MKRNDENRVQIGVRLPSRHHGYRLACTDIPHWATWLESVLSAVTRETVGQTHRGVPESLWKPHKSKEDQFLHRSYTPKKFSAKKNSRKKSIRKKYFWKMPFLKFILKFMKNWEFFRFRKLIFKYIGNFRKFYHFLKKIITFSKIWNFHNFPISLKKKITFSKIMLKVQKFSEILKFLKNWEFFRFWKLSFKYIGNFRKKLPGIILRQILSFFDLQVIPDSSLTLCLQCYSGTPPVRESLKIWKEYSFPP